MGNKQSKISVCSYCATEITLPSNNNHSSSSNKSITLITCPRCHGTMSQKNDTSNCKRNRFSWISTNHQNDEIISVPLKHLYIAPFSDTLHSINIEEKENISAVSDDDIINNYLQPFFNSNTNLLITASNRILIKNIEFKVFGCYPPKGFVNKSTKYHLNNTRLQFRPIHQIHILPTKSSLNTHNKIHKISNNNNPDLYESHIKPYLQKPTADSDFYININSDRSGTVSIKQYKRHLMENERFLSGGIEFYVFKCQPFDGYIDLRTTVIYCNGTPINDINNINIRPKSQLLPDIYKHYTSQQIQQIYLNEIYHIYGKYKYIDVDNHFLMDVNISDIEFVIYSDNDNCGIITCGTVINCEPIKELELLQIQSNLDMAYARRLQDIENGMRVVRNTQSNNEIFRLYNDPFMQFITSLSEIRVAAMDNHHGKGINKQIINRLPTYKYKYKSDNKCNDIMYHNSCRICLEDYIDSDELRILPCLHKYHSMCIDNWFKYSSKCPICLNSIFD